jgi:hypothetical protein
MSGERGRHCANILRKNCGNRCGWSLLAGERGTYAATNTKEITMKTTLTPALWRRITASALGAGAIAVGALAMGAPAANAATFHETCINSPGAYAAGAVRGVYDTWRYGDDRYERCKVYDPADRLLGTVNNPNYGWYLNPKNTRIAPPLLPAPAQSPR